MKRDASLRLNGLTMRAEPFYQGFDWDALLRKEIPAPFLPTAGDAEDDLAPNAEQCARLQVGAHAVGAHAKCPPLRSGAHVPCERNRR
eukprot:scaffold289291_cov30-Tisochrysis_lutea.AAC.2